MQNGRPPTNGTFGFHRDVAHAAQHPHVNNGASAQRLLGEQTLAHPPSHIASRQSDSAQLWPAEVDDDHCCLHALASGFSSPSTRSFDGRLGRGNPLGTPPLIAGGTGAYPALGRHGGLVGFEPTLLAGAETARRSAVPLPVSCPVTVSVGVMSPPGVGPSGTLCGVGSESTTSCVIGILRFSGADDGARSPGDLRVRGRRARYRQPREAP